MLHMWINSTRVPSRVEEETMQSTTKRSGFAEAVCKNAELEPKYHKYKGRVVLPVNSWKEAVYQSDVEEIGETGRSWRTNTIS